MRTLIALLLTVSVFAQDDTRIDDLIRQLGDDSLTARERAEVLTAGGPLSSWFDEVDSALVGLLLQVEGTSATLSWTTDREFAGSAWGIRSGCPL